MNWIIPLALLIIFEALADVVAKIWSLKGGWLLGAAALSVYVIANAFWLFALKNGAGLARGAVIFSIVSALLAIAIGIFFYKEHPTLHQTIGICFGVVAIIFLFWE